MKNMLAIELLKTFGESNPGLIPNIPQVIRKFYDDKGFDPATASQLGKNQVFGLLVRRLVFREDSASGATSLYDHAGKTLIHAQPAALPDYRGGLAQNTKIDQALVNSGRTNTGHVHGEGATTSFSALQNLNGTIPVPSKIPIAIIGYGTAGIIVARSLNELGFRNIYVFEKGNPLGIWSYSHVKNGTKNNPRTLSYSNANIAAAPGPGIDVVAFLKSLSFNLSAVKKIVTSIEPGSLDHAIQVQGEEELQRFPIVINTIGVGVPRALSDKNRMTTSVSQTEAGIRWQRQLTRAEVKDKRFIFIGLGNSTAEMLRQIHSFIDDGVNVDYRILTHYPVDAVWNPRAYVEEQGVTYRVFRDLSKLQLTRYQGDLPDSLQDYHRALQNGKIISGVRKWEIRDGKIGVFNHKPIQEIDYTNLYTLIGYAHSKHKLTTFGCVIDPNTDSPLHDYDGEFIRNPGAKGGNRLFKGYFGFGSILNSPTNQNATVIPGMFHRLGDLLFGVITRSLEYELNQK